MVPIADWLASMSRIAEWAAVNIIFPFNVLAPFILIVDPDPITERLLPALRNVPLLETLEVKCTRLFPVPPPT